MEISEEARRRLQASLELAGTGESEEVKSLALPAPQVDAKKIDEFRESMTKLLAKKRGLDTQINKSLRALGLTPAQLKGVKIELDGKGKIAVGGIEDVRLAKRIEESLAGDKELYSALKVYQRDEETLSAQLLQETGKSLADIRRTLLATEFAKENQAAGDDGTGVNWNEALASAEADASMTFSADLFRAAPELTELASQLATFDGVDFSSEKRGVGDPKGALEGVLRGAIGKITGRFNGFNKNVADTASSPEESFAKQLSLANVDISIGSDGSIVIKGKFSENAQSNAEAEKIVREEIQRMIEEDEATTGRESIFHTATRQMLVNHDEEFGEKTDKDVRLQISKGVGSAYLNAPGAEEGVKVDIREKAAEYLQRELGAKVDKDDLEVNDHGRVAFAKSFVDAGGVSEKLRRALDSLNSHITKLVSGKEAENKDPFAEPEKTEGAAKSIAQMIKEMATYRPGGLSGREGVGFDSVEIHMAK